MILDKLFQLMAEKEASDSFVSAGAAIHLKIHGVVMPVNQQLMEPGVIQRMAYEIMTPEQIQGFERTKEMNLSFGRRDMGNFRVSLFWQRGSVAIVVRFVRGEIPALDSLGLPAVLRDVIQEKSGLVLVVGAAGSGKSTTIAAMLDHRNKHKAGHILTLEDPIEYLFRHKKSVVNQREIGLDAQDWQSALKNAMRQAPDCLLIGEIRDRDTMQGAIAYAQTGHLCVATLHANSAHQALNRIANFFPLENRSLLHLDLSVALGCIVSQRLVKHADGRRIPAVEILMNTRHVAGLIEKGQFAQIKEAMEQSLAPASQTFEQDLFRLYSEGAIVREEALANADSPTNLAWLINNPQEGQRHKAAVAARPPLLDFDETEPDGASFKSFTLYMDDESAA